MFSYLGSIKTKPGSRDEVVAILLEGEQSLRAAGCHAYIVNCAADDPDTIWVYEIWESEEHHRASLELPETKDAIGRAMPLLTGELGGHRCTVAGGLGAPLG